jgi:hypothetical protein
VLAGWRVAGHHVGGGACRCAGAACRCLAQALGNQGFQRVGHLRRVQVKHQPVLVGRHRWQAEHLRRDGLLEVDHQAHHAGGELPDADAGDVGVVGRTLATSSRSAGFRSMPSMSTASRGGLGTKTGW